MCFVRVTLLVGLLGTANARVMRAESDFPLVISQIVKQASASSAPEDERSIPPVQTSFQRSLVERTARQAQVHSDAASTELRLYLDSAAFRVRLASCCPSIANHTSDELGHMFDEEVAASEVTHNS